MNDSIKNGYINWIDGMKISKDHFVDMQRAVEDRVRDVRSIQTQAWSFGVIPGKINGKEALDYNLLIEHPNAITLELYQCRAITPNGDRVEIVSSLNNNTAAMRERFEVDLAGRKSAEAYDVVLKVDSFDMAPYGDPNVKESPPRHPFAQPKYTLELVADQEIRYNEHNRNYVVLAKVLVASDGIRQDDLYIPPASAMDSLPELEDFYFTFLKFLNDLEQNLFRIITKLNGTERKSKLAQDMQSFVHRLADQLRQEIDAVTLLNRHQSAAELVVCAKRISRGIKHSLELMAGIGKDELLNYVQEVIGKSPGEYMGLHNDLIGMEYDHYDLNRCLTKVGEFCATNGKLFDELSRLDYIGKKKNTDMYVAEKTLERDAPQPKTKRKWDF